MPAWLSRLKAPALVALLLLLPVLIGRSTYVNYMLALITVYAIVAIGLNLLTGVAGQVSIGHAAFMAIGAYTSALLTMKAKLPFPIALLAAAIVAGAAGFLLGLPALRLQGHFLALATLSFGVVIPQVLLKWDKVTGGHMGLMPPKPSLFGLALKTEAQQYYFILCLALLLGWFAQNLVRSKPGRALIALRDSELAAQSMGVNRALYRTLAFAISAAYAGVGGSLYAHLVGFINPFDFNISISFQLLAMVVVGGLGSIVGAVDGAILLTLIPQLFSRVRGLTSAIEGAAIILVVMFAPQGLASLGRRARELWERLRPAGAAGGTDRGARAVPRVADDGVEPQEVSRDAAS